MTDFTCTHATHGYTRPARVSLLDMIAVYRQRRALAKLDETQLADIGLTRKEANAEARRNFWDISA